MGLWPLAPRRMVDNPAPTQLSAAVETSLDRPLSPQRSFQANAELDAPLATTAAPTSLQDILAPIGPDMAATDAVIRTSLDSEVALIGTVADHLIGAGGKRLRPAVLLLTARALGYSGKTHHDLAAVVEFIHTATLLHDDVVDDSSLRRGRATSNAMFGNAASVLVGDFLYSRAFQMMVNVASAPVLSILANATNRIAEGEVLQLMNVNDPSIDEARYQSVVDRKTATLFSAAAQLGAVVAGANAQTQSACAQYGSRLGTAFQMIDDLLDYAGNIDDIGKQLGDDLREGKCTLPLIHALSAAAPAEKEQIQRAIESGGGDFAQIAAIVQRSGSLDHVRLRAQAEVEGARQAALALPPSAYRDSLLSLALFALHRDR